MTSDFNEQMTISFGKNIINPNFLFYFSFKLPFGQYSNLLWMLIFSTYYFILFVRELHMTIVTYKLSINCYMVENF